MDEKTLQRKRRLFSRRRRSRLRLHQRGLHWRCVPVQMPYKRKRGLLWCSLQRARRLRADDRTVRAAKMHLRGGLEGPLVRVQRRPNVLGARRVRRYRGVRVRRFFSGQEVQHLRRAQVRKPVHAAVRREKGRRRVHRRGRHRVQQPRGLRGRRLCKGHGVGDVRLF